jgi:hypothetical protein
MVLKLESVFKSWGQRVALAWGGRPTFLPKMNPFLKVPKRELRRTPADPPADPPASLLLPPLQSFSL